MQSNQSCGRRNWSLSLISVKCSSIPWSQATPLGYFFEICFTIYYFEAYHISGSILILFIALCLHHHAFYQIFENRLEKLNHPDTDHNRKKLVFQLIRFHNSAKEWVRHQRLLSIELKWFFFWFCFQFVFTISWCLQSHRLCSFDMHRNCDGCFRFQIGFGEYPWNDCSTHELTSSSSKNILFSAMSTHWCRYSVHYRCCSSWLPFTISLLLLRETSHRLLCQNICCFLWRQLVWSSHWTAKMFQCYDRNGPKTNVLPWVWCDDVGFGDLHRCKSFLKSFANINDNSCINDIQLQLLKTVFSYYMIFKTVTTN